jgi:two-component system, OmpR family, phosphate regulon response regulator PhoB
VTHAPRGTAGPPAQVLIVEDDLAMGRLIGTTLGNNQLDVAYAGDGEEALRRVRSTPPDLVVLDVNLPGVDGIEVCRQLKGDPATRPIPIVMVTAREDDEAREGALTAGAAAYLLKPFSPRVLLDLVYTLLERRP